jgi:hypothetical protein
VISQRDRGNEQIGRKADATRNKLKSLWSVGIEKADATDGHQDNRYGVNGHENLG